MAGGGKRKISAAVASPHRRGVTSSENVSTIGLCFRVRVAVARRTGFTDDAKAAYVTGLIQRMFYTMMHALNGSKARLSMFRAAGTRVPLEDVVTSTAFGPLEFMPDEDRSRVLRAVFEALEIGTAHWSGSLTLHFWPRRSADLTLRDRYIEPDLMITDDIGPVVVMEVKWGAALGDAELAGQWTSLDHGERRRAVHLLLVRNSAPYRRSIEQEGGILAALGLADWNLTTRTWADLARSLEMLSASDLEQKHVLRWANGIAELLRREDGFAMMGWDRLDLSAVSQTDWRFSAPWYEGIRPLDDRPLGEWNFE